MYQWENVEIHWLSFWWSFQVRGLLNSERFIDPISLCPEASASTTSQVPSWQKGVKEARLIGLQVEHSTTQVTMYVPRTGNLSMWLQRSPSLDGHLLNATLLLRRGKHLDGQLAASHPQHHKKNKLPWTIQLWISPPFLFLRGAYFTNYWPLILTL